MLVCFGTRPEWLKIKPLIKLLEKNQYRLYFTGQQEDLIKGVDADYFSIIENKSNRLNSIISSCLDNIPNFFDYVLVQGDTASALGCAIAAFNLKKKVIYLESGLRTNNFQHPFPEEGYRQLISRIADIHFCPTNDSKQNLIKENVPEEKIYVVGNTVLDNIVQYKNSTYYGNDVVITLHRRENLGIMQSWIEQINKCVESNPDNNYIWPMHPNPEIQKFKSLVHHKINIISPLDHDSLIKLIVSCKFIITDSGGIQEEGCFLNKKSIVCRETTERPEGIHTGHLLICEKPENLYSFFNDLNKEPRIKNNICPYGDGKSSEKIIKVLKEKYII